MIVKRRKFLYFHIDILLKRIIVDNRNKNETLMNMIVARKKKSKVHEVADELRGYIEKEAFAPNTSIASSRELSDRFRVPLSTMNRALGCLVDEGLLYRRHGSGTFVKELKEPFSRKWRIGFYDSNDVAVRTPEGGILFGLYEHLVLDEFAKYDCDIRRYGFHDLRSEERSRMSFSELDGIWVSASLIDQQTMKNLYHFKGPIVIFNGISIFDFPAMQVLADWDPGIRQMLERLDIERYRKFLLLEGFCSPLQEVIMGSFRRQAAYFGIAPEQIEERLLQPSGDFSQQLGGYKFGMSMEPEEDVFIFSQSDFMTFGIIEAWKERGIPVGKYPLVGCFNMEGYGIKPFDEPMVTSINHDKEELVRQSIHLLVSALEDKDYCPKIIKIPSSLVIRKTAFA